MWCNTLMYNSVQCSWYSCFPAVLSCTLLCLECTVEYLLNWRCWQQLEQCNVDDAAGALQCSCIHSGALWCSAMQFGAFEMVECWERPGRQSPASKEPRLTGAEHSIFLSSIFDMILGSFSKKVLLSYLNICWPIFSVSCCMSSVFVFVFVFGGGMICILWQWGPQLSTKVQRQVRPFHFSHHEIGLHTCFTLVRNLTKWQK